MLLSPAAQSIITIDSVCLVWQKSPGIADKYKIEIFSDSLLSSRCIADSLLTDTIYTCRLLENYKSYWWRVSAHNASGWGFSCQAKKFIINIPTTAIVPEKVTLKMGGISGANGNIMYGLPKNSQVDIKVYDFRGMLVKVLVNSEQKAGFHSVSMKSTGIANGNFLMVFRTDNYLKTEKISVFNH
jgi:hypothetical protein